jgi:hypothetical protein
MFDGVPAPGCVAHDAVAAGTPAGGVQFHGVTVHRVENIYF